MTNQNGLYNDDQDAGSFKLHLTTSTVALDKTKYMHIHKRS